MLSPEARAIISYVASGQATRPEDCDCENNPTGICRPCSWIFRACQVLDHDNTERQAQRATPSPSPAHRIAIQEEDRRRREEPQAFECIRVEFNGNERTNAFRESMIKAGIQLANESAQDVERWNRFRETIYQTAIRLAKDAARKGK